MLKKTLAKNMVKSKTRFMSSKIDIQIKILNEILHSFQCNSEYTKLKELYLGEGKQTPKETGALRLGMNITNSEKKLSLVFQSPSGLFEKRIGLNGK